MGSEDGLRRRARRAVPSAGQAERPRGHHGRRRPAAWTHNHPPRPRQAKLQQLPPQAPNTQHHTITHWIQTTTITITTATCVFDAGTTTTTAICVFDAGTTSTTTTTTTAICVFDAGITTTTTTITTAICVEDAGITITTTTGITIAITIAVVAIVITVSVVVVVVAFLRMSPCSFRNYF